MNGRLEHFYLLRARGIKFFKAADMAQIDIWGGLYYTSLLIGLLCIVFLIDQWSEEKAEERAAPHKAQAEENMRAFNHVMQGKPLLIANEWKALLTCKAQEIKL